MDFIIGGLAGSGATIFTNPMDVVKTRLQLQGELRARNEHSSRYRGIFHGLYVIAKNDGIFALQKGLVPAMVFGFCMNSVRLGMYHVAEVQGWTKNKNGDISIHKTIFWSSASGVISGLAANPASVLKTRMQAAAHPSIAVGRQYVYDGMIDGCAKIYKVEGIRGFFAGVNATCTRLAIGSAVQLTTFSVAKDTLMSYGICEKTPLGLAFTSSCLSGLMVALAICPLDVVAVRLYNQGNLVENCRSFACKCCESIHYANATCNVYHPHGLNTNHIKHSNMLIACKQYSTRIKKSLLEHGILEHSPATLAFTASVVCGVACIFLETPLDVVNTRLYNQGPARKGKLLYNGVLDCLKKTYMTEGLQGLYKGIGPFYLRIAPHTTLSLVIWDMLNILFENKRN